MKHLGKKALAWLLCMLLCAGLLPFGALAEDSDELLPDPNAEVVVLETVTEYNPVYTAYLTHEQIDALAAPSETKGTRAATADPQYATTPAEAGALLRAGIKARENPFPVYIIVPKDSFDDLGASYITGRVWYEAYAVTRNGQEGDYLHFDIMRRTANTSYTTSSDGQYVFLTINYTFIYATTAAQEREMSARADETIGYFGFSRQTSAYDKIRTIYSYLTDNITYASDNVDTPLYHTAYSAIVLKDTVCQGFAQLLYYMLWKCEIPCRIVTSDTHAWNLVWLRGQWYSLDATWDAGNQLFDYFLRGKDTEFYDNEAHVPEDSTIAALINQSSSSDYGSKRSADYGKCTTHINASTTYTTDDGTTCYWCSVCGQSATGRFGTYRYIAEGYCGDNLIWAVDNDGVLGVIGSGDMWDNKVIWFPYRNCILTVLLSDEITSIGALAFDHAEYIEEVYMPQKLVRIGEAAFQGCVSLNSVSIFENVTLIDTDAFADCTSLTDVYYIGTPSQWNAITINSGNACLNNANRHYLSMISFDANGGSGEMKTAYHYIGVDMTLPENTFSREGYTFTGWNTKADGSGTAYADGASFSVSGNITLYAQWKSDLSITSVKANTTTAKTGEKITWTATASGGFGALQYYFAVYKDGTPVAKRGYSTTRTYSYTPTEPGTYKVRVYVKDANETKLNKLSAAVTVTLGPPAITTQPAAKTVAEGKSAVFTVAAVGTGLTYQWQYSKDGGTTWYNKSGATETSYTVTAKTSYDGFLYRCKVKNSAGTVYSNSAKLTVTAANPVITTQPANQTAAAGATVTFKVAATGTGLTYQWQYSKDGGSTWYNKSGATSDSCSVTAKAAYSGFLYRCKVKNAGGIVYSNSAKLTVTASKPVITTQPAAKTVSSGETATFTVSASGTGLTYQWQYSKDGGTTWYNKSGATAASCSATAKASYSGILYRCKVKNAGGTVYTSGAKLTVN